MYRYSFTPTFSLTCYRTFSSLTQVGGEFSTTVIKNLNDFGRASICGAISQYNAEDEENVKGMVTPVCTIVLWGAGSPFPKKIVALHAKSTCILSTKIKSVRDFFKKVDLGFGSKLFPFFAIYEYYSKGFVAVDQDVVGNPRYIIA